MVVCFDLTMADFLSTELTSCRCKFTDVNVVVELFIFALPVTTDFAEETDHQKAEDLSSNKTIRKILHGRRGRGLYEITDIKNHVIVIQSQ